MSRKWADRALLALFIGMAVLLYRSAAGFPGIAQTTSARYVRFLAVFIGILALVQLGLNLLKDRSRDRLQLTDNLPRFIGLVIGLIIFALLFEPLGFFIPAAIFIPSIAVMLGYRNALVIGLTTAGVLIFVWLVFIRLLGIHLPGFNL